MKVITFCLLLFLITTTLHLRGQHKVDTTNKIQIVPISGKLEFVYKDSTLENPDQVAIFLSNSGEANVIKRAKRFKRRSAVAGAFLGIGIGFAGIWSINESANTQFHASTQEDRLWYGIVVGTTFTFSAVGAIIFASAKKQLILGVEEFNETTVASENFHEGT